MEIRGAEWTSAPVCPGAMCSELVDTGVVSGPIYTAGSGSAWRSATNAPLQPVSKCTLWVCFFQQLCEFLHSILYDLCHFLLPGESNGAGFRQMSPGDRACSLGPPSYHHRYRCHFQEVFKPQFSRECLLRGPSTDALLREFWCEQSIF